LFGKGEALTFDARDCTFSACAKAARTGLAIIRVSSSPDTAAPNLRSFRFWLIQ